MKLRYLAIVIVLAIFAPQIKSTIIYAAEVKATYDQVQEIKSSEIVMKLAGVK